MKRSSSSNLEKEVTKKRKEALLEALSKTQQSLKTTDDLTKSPWYLGATYEIDAALGEAISLKAPKICRGVSFFYPHILAVNLLFPQMKQFGRVISTRSEMHQPEDREPFLIHTQKWDCGVKQTLNILFNNNFEPRSWKNLEGTLGGTLRPLIDDSRVATIT